VTGDSVVKHLKTYYSATRVDHVIATHCDRDHSGGLRTVLTDLEIGTLWMLRPWEYADELLPRFPTYTSTDRLRSRLRSIYSNLVVLEDIALDRGIPIRDPLQGADIGAFKVLAPSRELFLDLIVESDNTPESIEESAMTSSDRVSFAVRAMLEKTVELL